MAWENVTISVKCFFDFQRGWLLLLIFILVWKSIHICCFPSIFHKILIFPGILPISMFFRNANSKLLGIKLITYLSQSLDHVSLRQNLFFFFHILLLLLLLLSHFSHVWLCATPQMAAEQAPPSLGFSRQEHWSGLPFPFPMHKSEKCKWSLSVVPTFSDPMDYGLAGSSIHGICQARVLKWGVIAFSIFISYPSLNPHSLLQYLLQKLLKNVLWKNVKPSNGFAFLK